MPGWTCLSATLSRRRSLSAEAERHQGVHVWIVLGREIRSFDRVAFAVATRQARAISTGA